MVDQLIDGIIEREGGYVDRLEDRGGPTKYGITLKRLARWLNRAASVDDVRQLGEPTARMIYRDDIAAVHLDQIHNACLLELLADSAANHGPARAIKFLQAALQLPVDGVLGPKTLYTVQRAWAPSVYREVLAKRAEFYGRLITDDRTDADHDGVTDAAEMAAGWMARLAVFIKRCP